MKRLFTILAALLITATAFLPQQATAQTPDNMNYQAVIRDIDGNLMANHEVGIQISIFQGSVDDPPIYVERQYPTTNANGLVTLIIGDGNVIVGDYSTINWANLPFFLRTETDMEGGENYTILGDSDMLSVSYALHAKTADSVIGGVTEIDPVFAASVAGGITETDTAYWNDKLDTEVDGDITNELQLIDIFDNTIYLTDGGYAELPLEIDPVFDSSVAGGITAVDTANWNAGGGAETDPIFDTSVAGGITAADTANWNAGAVAIEINDLTDGKTGGNSVFLGEGAGAVDDLSDNHNVFVGYKAGNANTTGTENTATGTWALKHNITGIRNTANGSEALFSNTTGNYNTATGVYTLHENTTGIENTAMGFQTLGYNTEGANNTASGYWALVHNTTGDGNTASGYTALKTNTTGSHNSAFGYEADVSSDSLTNATAIGYKAKVATSNSLVLGATGTDAVNVGIGTDSPHETAVLDMVSTTKGMLIPRMLEAEKTGITTPATGLMIYQTNGARGFYYYDGTAWKSIGAGVLGINDLIDGNTTGSENVFLGEGAGSKNTTGAFNTAIGAHALDSLSTGSWNTATGALALADNTTGIQNSATGFQALSSNTTGTDNTATGGQALSSNTTGNYNTATGFQALNENTEASWITATGYHALRYNTTGAENTAAGAFALQTNTTGSSNTAFGYEADVSSGDLSNATAIGYKAKVATSNSLVLGGLDETGSGGEDNSVKVGIGTDSPSATLDVVGAVQIDSTLDVDGFTYLKDDVKVDGNTLLMSDLDVAGDASIAGKVYIISTLDVYNDVTVDGALTVTQNTFLESTVEFYDDVYIDSTLNVEQSTLLHSTLKVDGAVTMSYDSGNDYYVHLDDTHYTYTTNTDGYISLPTATPGNKGRIYIIKSTVNNEVRVQTTGSQTIDGIDGYTLHKQWEYVKVQSTGSDWVVIGQNRDGIPNKIADADNDTKVQVEKTDDDDIIHFDLGGTEHFKMDGPRLEVLNSGQSVFIGEGAGAADNLGNNHNVFVGFDAGHLNTTGEYNIAIGQNTLFSNTTASFATAIGYGSLNANTTGAFNTATGSYSLLANTSGAENTAFGFKSLLKNLSGGHNTATGSWALQNNTTGNENTAIGHLALHLNTTGNNNTALGAGADVTANNLSNATAIGYKAKVATSNSLVLGGTGADAVKVGINTDSPDASAALDIVSTDKGLLIPRLSDAEVTGISNPATGLMVYNTTQSCIQINTGTPAAPDWQCLGLGNTSLHSYTAAAWTNGGGGLSSVPDGILVSAYQNVNCYDSDATVSFVIFQGNLLIVSTEAFGGSHLSIWSGSGTNTLTATYDGSCAGTGGTYTISLAGSDLTYTASNGGYQEGFSMKAVY